MPVFDFNDVPEKERTAECTYTTFSSNNSNPTPEQPIMVLDNQKRKWQHHSCGRFTNPVKRTAFEFEEEDGTERVFQKSDIALIRLAFDF